MTFKKSDMILFLSFSCSYSELDLLSLRMVGTFPFLNCKRRELSLLFFIFCCQERRIIAVKGEKQCCAVQRRKDKCSAEGVSLVEGRELQLNFVASAMSSVKLLKAEGYIGCTDLFIAPFLYSPLHCAALQCSALTSLYNALDCIVI